MWSHSRGSGLVRASLSSRSSRGALSECFASGLPATRDVELARFEASLLVDERDADLHVRAWRFSYNARGIIEMPNRLKASKTAVIVVHPWGIDDGQGWKTPEPNGVCDFCTPTKNQLAARHTSEVINPFLKSLRDKIAFVMYSLPGPGDPVRKKLEGGDVDKIGRVDPAREIDSTVERDRHRAPDAVECGSVFG